jgi:bis(5'-nucleosyl)-tetraphosphatase (symmetrical)
MARLIVYGDIHGCLDELIALRKKIGINPDDIEVCAGDMITKGSNSVETLKYIRKKNLFAVLGNQEEKILQYIKKARARKKDLPKVDKDQKNILKNLSFKDIAFLEALPYFIRFEEYLIVHGGIQNSMDLDNLTLSEKSKITRMRYLDEKERFLPYGKETRKSTFWSDIYDGSKGFVLFGHNKFKEPKISPYAIGLDTGCVYGNRLSAVIIQNGEKSFQSVEFGERKNNEI